MQSCIELTFNCIMVIMIRGARPTARISGGPGAFSFAYELPLVVTNSPFLPIFFL